jgi:hypothetical protein
MAHRPAEDEESFDTTALFAILQFSVFSFQFSVFSFQIAPGSQGRAPGD